MVRISSPLPWCTPGAKLSGLNIQYNIGQHIIDLVSVTCFFCKQKLVLINVTLRINWYLIVLLIT